MPFIEIHPFEILGLKLHAFGILVAIGVLVGSSLARWYAEKNDLDVDDLRWLGFRLVVGGFIACHIVDAVFYNFDALKDDPILLFKIWAGISSYGGIMGACVLFWWFTRPGQGPRGKVWDRMKWGDMIVFGFAAGLTFGRMGCTVAHDHIGTLTTWSWAIQFPEDCTRFIGTGIGCVPGLRHDLGLYELIGVMPIVVGGLFLMLLWKNRPAGLMIVYGGLTYSIPRFFLEFLRRDVTDPRTFGLTPAQYFSIIIAIASLWVLFRVIPRREARIRQGLSPVPGLDEDDDEEDDQPVKARPKPKPKSKSSKGKKSGKGKGKGKSKK